jgi:hypothetical protein
MRGAGADRAYAWGVTIMPTPIPEPPSTDGRPLDRLAAAVSALVDQALDRVLLTDERITSAAEGRRALSSSADTEELADTVQKVVVLAVPVMRTLARGARFTRIPWVMVASTAVSLTVAVRTGVRELQVIAALVAHRLEETTGVVPDPALVKRLAVDLYLDPKRTPDPGRAGGRTARVARRWLTSGALARDTSGKARRSLEAAERLDVPTALARWRTPSPLGRGAPR